MARTGREIATAVTAAESPRPLPWNLDERAQVTIDDGRNRQTRSVADLLDDGLRIAGGLRKEGIGPGRRVGLYAHTSFDFLCACIGVWASGNTVVTLAPPPPLGVELGTAGGHPAAALTEVIVGEGGTPTIAELIRSKPLELEPAPIDEPALIQHSSGSTAQAKGIVLSHRALGRYMTVMAAHLGDVPERPTRIVSWLPLQHDLGFVHYLLYQLSTGAALSLMSPWAFLRDPLRWIAELDRFEGEVTAAPCFAYAIAAKQLENHSGRTFRLDQVAMAGCGGEPVDPRVLQRFADAAQPHGFDPAALVPGYGLAEATCAVTIGRLTIDRVGRTALGDGRAEPASASDRSVEIASVGRAVPGNEIVVMGAEGNEVDERVLGEICVRSPYAMDGYTDPTAPSCFDAGGWLHTGDRGYLADGELYVTGRIKDLVISGGRKFHAEDIERVVGALPGMRPGSCIAVGIGDEAGLHERLVLLAEAEPGRETDQNLRARVQKEVRRELGLLPRHVELLPRGSLPKTTSGKLQRSRARDLYEKGELRA